MQEPFAASFALAARYIAQADSLVIAAGAGMGVDSGLPDFRGNAGFWNAYPALGAARIEFMDIASPTTFRDDPALAWGFYGHRLSLYRDTAPHAGFGILRKWASRVPRGAFVFTSNVDGQFQAAGFGDDRVSECHGSIHWLQCAASCGQPLWAAGGLRPVIDAQACRWLGELPPCPSCAGLARPNILMFGDDRWISARSDEQQQRLSAWLRGARRPIVVELGAGTHIPSVRLFGEQVVRGGAGRLIRINPREAEVASPLDCALPFGALQALRRIDAHLDAP
jgi:NAD-dependent SIR2 family protein deacetylase